MAKMEWHGGHVWARYGDNFYNHGVSVQVHGKLEDYVDLRHDDFGNPFAFRWTHLDDKLVLTNCVTGEIVMENPFPTRRIPCKLARIPDYIEDFFWETESLLEELRNLSLRLYGTADLNSPLWPEMEKLLDRIAANVAERGISMCVYEKIFYDTANRIAHGLHPVEN